MTELDFEELDKAVHTLMGDLDTSKRNPALDDPEVKVVTLSSPADEKAATSAVPAADPNTMSAPVKPMNTAVESTAPTAGSSPASASLAVKRRGQFMDVIPPTASSKAPVAPVSRQGTTLQPTTEIKPEAPSPAEPTLDPFTIAGLDLEMESTGTGTPPPVHDEAKEVESVPVDEPVKSEWPDPIDMAAPLADEEATEIADMKRAELGDAAGEENAPELPADIVDEVAQPADAEPLTSPFLPDAKVEKRPLGMPVAEETDGATEPIEESDAAEVAADDAETDTPDTRPIEKVPEVLLPEELKADIVSLESSSVVAAVTEAPEATEEAPENTATPASATVTGPQSIPQQYAEQPSSGNQSNTPIFDTSTHTQPLEVPKKKKSPLVWLLAVIILLIIGAVGGAALFYFTTQMR